ncbi:MAG TPA: cytidylate kinase-like family protein [Candidatus Aquilonibacter sp.]
MIVTISREYGAQGRAVTRGLADLLGYRLLDEDLPVVVAARLGTSPEVVEGIEYRQVGFGTRLLRSFSAAVPEAFQPSAEVEDLTAVTQREIEQLIREAADAGDVIVVGRLGNVVLRGRPDVLRVFLTAPPAWRIAQIVASLGVSESSARAEIARVDGGRRNYAREQYDFDWGDPHEYDLVIDVSRFGVDGSIALIDAARRAIG